MEKRHLVVGVVMFLASAASYGLVQMTEASPTVDVIAVASPVMSVTSVAPLITAAPALEFSETFGSLSDTTMMFAAGAVLLGLAAGVRRHTC